jgi:mannose-6-phosphate isomerase-like protein (cupin superfamily)
MPSGAPRVDDCRLDYMDLEKINPSMVLKEINLQGSDGPMAPFKASYFIVEPGGTTEPDQHEVLEIWMIARGRGVITYDGHDIPVTKGDMVYFESNRSHIMVNDGDEDAEIFSVWWRPEVREPARA